MINSNKICQIIVLVDLDLFYICMHFISLHVRGSQTFLAHEQECIFLKQLHQYTLFKVQ